MKTHQKTITSFSFAFDTCKKIFPQDLLKQSQVLWKNLATYFLNLWTFVAVSALLHMYTGGISFTKFFKSSAFPIRLLRRYDKTEAFTAAPFKKSGSLSRPINRNTILMFTFLKYKPLSIVPLNDYVAGAPYRSHDNFGWNKTPF